MNSNLKIVSKTNGKFGVRRGEHGEVRGDFDSYVEALVAIGQANAADTYRQE